MNLDRETVIRMAVEARITEHVSLSHARLGALERFATLVLEHGRKPLTDDELGAMFACAAFVSPSDQDAAKYFARAIEAAHGITNKESN